MSGVDRTEVSRGQSVSRAPSAFATYIILGACLLAIAILMVSCYLCGRRRSDVQLEEQGSASDVESKSGSQFASQTNSLSGNFMTFTLRKQEEIQKWSSERVSSKARRQASRHPEKQRPERNESSQSRHKWRETPVDTKWKVSHMSTIPSGTSLSTQSHVNSELAPASAHRGSDMQEGTPRSNLDTFHFAPIPDGINSMSTTYTMPPEIFMATDDAAYVTCEQVPGKSEGSSADSTQGNVRSSLPRRGVPSFQSGCSAWRTADAVPTSSRTMLAPAGLSLSDFDNTINNPLSIQVVHEEPEYNAGIGFVTCQEPPP